MTVTPDLRVDALVAAAGLPDDDAVMDADGRLTYGELLGGADRLATALRAHGVRAGSLVGVCLPRSAALVQAWLGVLRAEAAYVALDPDQPAERLRQLVSESGVALVVATAGAGLGRPDDDGLVWVGETGRTLPAGLAYVCFTSGSTGTPKGVLVEQAGLRNLVDWHRRAFDIGRGTRCSQVAGVGFDAAAWEVWGTLCAGGTLVVPPQSVPTDPVAMRDWLLAEAVEVAFLPTPLAEAVLALSWPADAPLRTLLTGGDRLHAAPRTELPFAVINNYGLTEASVVTASAVVPADRAAGLPSIGSPIDGVTVRVVDAGLRPAETGELLVGGVSLARGYLGAPELTADRFVELDGERWYRTGDLVRRESGNALAFVGRADEQLQVRGLRVEPAEIEAVLCRHPAVRAAAVRSVAGRLVAWFVGAAEADELREHLARWLPPQMVPEAFVPMPRLPVTAHGKVDIAALTLPEPQPRPVPETGDALVAAVADLVAELLDLPAVGADENFLLLGGHSLLGAQLVVRLADTLGVELGLRELFEDPTPAGISARVLERLAGEPAG